jgi:hypothetical protein
MTDKKLEKKNARKFLGKEMTEEREYVKYTRGSFLL